MTIGYINPAYPTLRNIINKCPGTKYVRVRSFGSMMAKVTERLGIASVSAIAQMTKRCAFSGGVPMSFAHIDLMHFFNNIALSPCRKKFVTTFETTLPRFFKPGSMMQRGFDSLLSNRCRRLIALSEHARLRQMAFNAEYGVEEINKKISVLLPPQEVLARESDILLKIDKFMGGGGANCRQ